MTVENIRPPKPKKPARAFPWAGLLVAVVVIVIAVWLYLRMQAEVATSVATPVAALAPAEAAAADGEPKFPVPEASVADTEPDGTTEPALPDLADSDAQALAALTGLFGAGQVTDWFYAQHLIGRFVATVDALPRAKMAPLVLPMKRVSGTLVIAREPGLETIAPANAERYRPYVQAFDQLDSVQVVGLYHRWYPLFQKAYRQLGYPKGHFNDRLVEVIDHLLQTPNVPEPIAVRFNGQAWEYVDPALEARSVGHKLMLRIGAENARTVQLKLKRLRLLLTAKPGSP